MLRTDKRLLKDPVCGMTVSNRSPHMTVHQDTAVYFCSAGCQTKFLVDPAKYSVSADAVHQPVVALKPAAGIIYTCPMHPQIRQIGPGSCPICGMTLESEIPTLETDDNPELKDFRQRFFWTLPLTVIVAVLAMAGHGGPWCAVAE